MEVKCLCGKLAFRMPKPNPVKVIICHCTLCQRQSNLAWICSVAFRLFDVDQPTRKKMDVFGGEYCASSEHTTIYTCLMCNRAVMHTVPKQKYIYVRAECLAQVPWKKAIHIYCSEAVVPPSPSSVRYRYEEGSYEEGSGPSGSSLITIKDYISSAHTSASFTIQSKSTSPNKSRFSGKLFNIWKKPGSVKGKDPLAASTSSIDVSSTPRDLRVSLSMNNLATIASHANEDQLGDVFETREIIPQSARVSRRRSMLDLVLQHQGTNSNMLSVIPETDDGKELLIKSVEKVVPYVLDIKPGFPPMNNDEMAPAWKKGHKHKISEDSIFYNILLDQVQREPTDAPIGHLLDMLEIEQSASSESASISQGHLRKRSKTLWQDSKVGATSSIAIEPYDLGLVPGFPEYESVISTKLERQNHLTALLIKKQDLDKKGSRALGVEETRLVDQSNKLYQLLSDGSSPVNAELAKEQILQNMSMGVGFEEIIEASLRDSRQPSLGKDKNTPKASILSTTIDEVPFSGPSTAKEESKPQFPVLTDTIRGTPTSTPSTAKGKKTTLSLVSVALIDKALFTSPRMPVGESTLQIPDLSADVDEHPISSPSTPHSLTIDSIRAILALSPSIQGEESTMQFPIMSSIVNKPHSETPSPVKPHNPLKFAAVVEEDEPDNDEEYTIKAKGHLDHMAKHLTMNRPKLDRPKLRRGPASSPPISTAPSPPKDVIAAREAKMLSNPPIAPVFSTSGLATPNEDFTAPKPGERGTAEHNAFIAGIRKEVAAMEMPPKRLLVDYGAFRER